MRACAVLFCLGVALVSAPAAAGEAAAAEVLFDDGVAAMQAGDYEKGCPLVAESQRMEPRPGTLFTLAECRRLEGRTATALARYQEYVRRFERMDDAERRAQRGRDALAREQVETLKAQSPKLELVLARPLPDGAVVTRDGVALGAPSLGRALPVDPGRHTIVVTAPGHHEIELTVEALPGETTRVDLPGLQPLSPPPDPAPAPVVPAAPVAPVAPAPAVPATVPTAPAADATGPSAWQVTSYGLIGLGAASLIAGAVTGGIALERDAEIRDEECTFAGGRCSEQGVEQLNDVGRLADASTGTLIAGALLGGAGVVLLLVEPEENTSTSLKLRLSPSSLILHGAF